jgi:threonine synthase
MKTIAYEIWEQLGWKAPDAVILPLGQGGQLLGLAAGFNDLLEAGDIDHLPALIGVQAAACAPLWATLHANGVADQPVSEHPTAAEGIRIVHPIRHEAILLAIRATAGDILAVQEEDILSSLRELAQAGFVVEPTSAVVLPGLRQVTSRFPEGAVIVLSLTGSGYKTPQLPQLAGLA